MPYLQTVIPLNGIINNFILLRSLICSIVFLAVSIQSCKVPDRSGQDISNQEKTGPGISSPDRSGNRTNNKVRDNENSYAENFKIRQEGDELVLTVLSPWQQSERLSFRYVLKRKTGPERQTPEPVNIPDPDSPEDEQTVLIPVKKVVVTSTTHVSFLNELGQSNSIRGVSGGRYIFDSELGKQIENGSIRDIGYDQSLNYELIISMQPDVVFVYGVTGEIYNHISHFRKMGIPVVIISEYLEKHPLGKAEWIRFFAAFFDMTQRADSIFGETRKTYESLTELTAGMTGKPTVLSGLPWKDAWWVPGGRSFAAQFIKDAGGDYLWKDNSSFEAIPLDIEAVYNTAGKADIWINPGSALSIGEIVSADSRLGGLQAVAEGQVYNNDARLNKHGGNDYWESGVCHPELILADLISIFHPALLQAHQRIYYRKLGSQAAGR